MSNRFRPGLAIAVASAAVLTLGGCATTNASPGTSAGGESLTTLKVAVTGYVGDGSLLTGIENGYFEDEGLKLDVSVVASPAAGVAAAQSGAVDVAFSTTIPVINALSQDVKLKIVAAADGYIDGASRSPDAASLDDSGLYVSGSSEITSIEQLAGKTVAVPARQAMFEVAVADELDRAGLSPDDVQWVVLDFTSAVAALQNGTVDAASLVSPFMEEAEGLGAVRIGSPTVSLFEEGAVSVWVAGASTVAAKSDAIAGFARAISHSNEYANENRELVAQAGLDFSGSKLAPGDVKIPYWPTEVRMADLERMVAKLVKLGYLPEAIDLDDLIFKG